MPEDQQPTFDLSLVQATAGAYPLEAFQFVRDGLGHTSKKLHPEAGELTPQTAHVSGQQLCLGLLDYALDRYGMLAPVVMEHWNIQRTDDFGRIVFALVGVGLLRTTQSDRPEDFRGVYDFAEVFAPDAIRKRILEHKN